MSSYLGGMRILFIGWQGPSTIRVDFSSTYGVDYLYQLYAGRKLIGGTTTTGERFITAPLVPSDWPQWLQVVAITPDLQGSDLGSNLPERPYNAAKITLDTTGWPDDSKAIEVIAGTVPGGAVSPTNIVAHQLVIDPTATYTVFSEPLGPSGAWNFEAYGIDSRPPDGNHGTALALSTTLLTQPKDFAFQSDDSRFLASATSGTLTCSYTFAG